MTINELGITLVLTVIGCTGFWTFLNNMIQNRNATRKAEKRALLGLLHEELVRSCVLYIARGSITRDEYEDLRRYIYEPYAALGGNGTGEKLMGEVNKLPIKEVRNGE